MGLIKQLLPSYDCGSDVSIVRSFIQPQRMNGRRITAKGMFPGAEVMRGHDWLWGDQDGEGEGEGEREGHVSCFLLLCSLTVYIVRLW